MWLRFLALVCLVGAALAGPVQRLSKDESSNGIDPSPGLLHFEPGNSYTYHWELNNAIIFAKLNQTTEILNGIIELSILSDSKRLLAFKTAKILQNTPHSDNDELIEQLKVPLVCSYTNSNLENVCPSSKESKQSLNLKKAILSALIFKMDNQTDEEVDSFGKCRTEYTEQEDAVISKRKDLSTCTGSSSKTRFSNYFTELFVKEHRSECNYTFNDDRSLGSVDCLERQSMINLPNDTPVMDLIGKLKLVHIETKPFKIQSREEHVNKCKKIPYDIDDFHHEEKNEEEIKNIFKDSCSKRGGDFDMSLSKKFLKLVSLLRTMKYPPLVELHKSIKDGSFCSSQKLLNWFGDALAASATVPCVNMMIKMLGTDDATPIQKSVWLPIIASLSNPDKDTMEATTLLMEKDQSPLITVVFGAVIHTFCVSNDCKQTQAVNDFIAKQNENLGINCSSDDHKQILTTLRLLGNMGYHGEAHRNIKACIKDRSKPTALRMAAVHACRNTDDGILPVLLQILDDNDEDTELKIECISHILKHGNEEHIKLLKSKMEKEKNMQVSSFMYTLIKNIQKRNDPIYIKSKKILKDYINSHRNENSSTCSRNIVYSHFIKATKTYLVWETNVVCSNKSNMPIFISTHIRSGRTKIAEMRLRSVKYEDTFERFLRITERKHDLKRLLHKIAQKRNLDELKTAVKEILNDLHLDKLFDSNPEMDLSFSVKGIEILSVSTSDLSSMYGVVKIAEFLPKLPYFVDSSLSFPLLNYEVKMLSITGRSRNFKLAGSATVGLTAQTKANTMNSQQHLNLETLFNPSFSWNMDMEGGIESNPTKQSFSAQAALNLASKLEVSKAGVSCELKFRNNAPLMVRLSTECSRLNEDKQEISLFGEKETKIDKCFEPMKKFMGIAPCIKLEAPKGRMAINSMSSEFAWRTFDAKSYLFKIEIPKKNASSMKYSTSIDTPNSKIPRRFEALLEVKSQRDQKDVLLEFKSPYETIGGSCSLKKNNENLETSLAIHSSKSQIASVTMSSRLISTRARKMLVLSAGYSLLGQKEKRINGTFTKTNGRKHHVSFDVRSNSPELKPIAVKGTLMKEGIFELSPENEFKISSEISLQTPIGDIKLRKTMEKRSKQSQWLSANSVIEYQMRERKKHSLIISATSHKNSNKRNTVTSIVSSQFPAANMKMTWNSQRESQEIFNNDMKLQRGENQNETFFLFKHTTHIPKQGPGNCSINMEIPHRNWRRQVSFNHLLNLKSETPRAHFNFDISNEDDKHVRIGMDVECKSKSPLKASGRLELEYPDVHYIYEDKIEESSDNVIQGISKFQKKTGEKMKQSEIRYKYRKLSRGSKVHHEIESSIHTPLFKSPINGKASIELNRESLAISGHVGPHYSIEAHLKEYGVSHIHLKLPIIESKVNFTKKDTKSIINAVVETKRQQYVLEVMADCGNKKEFEFKCYPKNDYKNQILVSMSGEKISKELFSGNARLNIFNIVDVSLVEVGHLSLLGDHDLTLNIKNKVNQILTIKCKRKVSNEKGTHTITIYERDIKKWSMEMESKLKQTEHITDFGISFSVVKLHSDVFPNGLEVNTRMPDTRNNYEKSNFSWSLQVSSDSISSDLNVARSDNNNIYIQTKIETRDDSLILKSKIKFRNETFADVKVTVSKQSVEGQMDTKSGISGKIIGSIRKTTTDIQLEGSIQLHNRRDKKFREITTGIKFSGSKLSISGNIKQENDQNFSLVSEGEVKGNDIYIIANVVSPHKHWKDVKAHISVKCQLSKTSISYGFDVNGKSKVKGEVTLSISSQKVELKILTTRHNSSNRTVITVKSEKNKNGVSVTANIMKDTSSLLSTRLDLSSHEGKIKVDYMNKSILHVEFSKISNKDQREYGLKVNGPQTGQYHFIFTTKKIKNNSVRAEFRVCRQFESKQECSRVICDFDNWSIQAYAEKSVGGSDYHPVGNVHLLLTSDLAKLIFMVNEHKRGIELNINQRKDVNDSCSVVFQLYLPSCTIVVGASFYHNENNIKIKVYARPNTKDPKSNIEISINRHYNPNSHEVTGLINITSEKTELIAINYTYGLVKGTDLALPLYFGRVVIYSGHDNSWTMEALPDIEQESSGKRRLVYRLSRNDQEIASLHLKYENTKDKKEIGCHWNYVTSGAVRERGLKVAVSSENRGKAMKVSYSSPSAKYEVQTSISARTNEINFSLASSDRKIKEVNIKIIPSGIEVELKNSAESDSGIKFVIRVDKTGQNKVHWVRFIADYCQRNCIDIQVGADPVKSYDVVFNINYKRDVCQQAWKNFRYEFLPKFGLPQEFRKFKEITVKEVKKLNLCLIDEPKCNLKNEVKEYIEKLIKHLQSAIPAPIKEACKKVHEHLVVKAAIFCRRAKEIVSQYWPVICEAGWYCSDIKSAFENFDTREARVMIERKVNEMKQFLSPRSLRSLSSSDFINFLKNLIQGAEKLPESITIPFYSNFMVRFFMNRFKNFITALKKDVEHWATDFATDFLQRFMDMKAEFLQRIIDFVSKVRHHWFEDENIQKAQVLILDAKDKMIKAWNNREEIATYHVRRVENSIKENWKKLVDNHVEVSKYDPNRGEIKFSVRPPSLKSDIEYMKQEFRQIFRKLREFLNRRNHQ